MVSQDFGTYVHCRISAHSGSIYGLFLAGMQVHVNPPKSGLTVDLAVNQYHFGWAALSSTGDTAVIKWENSNTMSKC